MKTKTLLISSFLLMSLAFLPAVSQAQETVPPSQEESIPTVAVATVNIYNAKIVSQDKNNIIVSFDLSNRENAQPGVKYAISLVKKESEDERILMDEKVYAEVVALSENTTINKTITYQAPDFLSGAYEIWVISQNDKGFPFGQNMAGEVTLSGTNEYIALSSCHLSIQGEDGNKKYTLSEGVAVNPEEVLLANCTAKNNFKTEQAITPTFTTYYRNIFGEKLNEAKQPVITFQPNETKEVSFILPGVQKPQAYDAVLTLANSQNKIIAEKIPFHYVIGGESATIQNLRLDKDYYAKDDTAKISFFATFSASNFPGSRLALVTDEKVNLEIFINSENKACAETIKKELTESKQIDLEALITKECLNPEAMVILKDQNGNILDQANLKFASQQAPDKDIPAPITKSAEGKTGVVVFLGIITLALIVVLVLIYRKNRSGAIKSFLIFFAFGALIMFGGGEKAKADTTFNLISDQYGLPTNIVATASTDKREYIIGENVLAYGGVSFAGCSNAINITSYQILAKKLETNEWPSVLSRYTNIGTSYIPGNRDVNFYSSATWTNAAGDWSAQALYYYPITFVAPCTGDDPLNATICANDYGTFPKTLVSSCTEATKCEYICNDGYVYYPLRNECMLDCVGNIPENSQICIGDALNLSLVPEERKRVLVNSCSSPDGSNPKCEYTCVEGYVYDPINKSCIENPVCQGDVPSTARRCPEDGNGPGNWEHANNNSCSDAPCEWTCEPPRDIYNPGLETCERDLMEGKAVPDLSFCQIPNDRSVLCSEGTPANVRQVTEGNIVKWKWICLGSNSSSIDDDEEGEALKDCSWTEVNP